MPSPVIAPSRCARTGPPTSRLNSALLRRQPIRRVVRQARRRSSARMTHQVGVGMSRLGCAQTGLVSATPRPGAAGAGARTRQKRGPMSRRDVISQRPPQVADALFRPLEGDLLMAAAQRNCTQCSEQSVHDAVDLQREDGYESFDGRRTGGAGGYGVIMMANALEQTITTLMRSCAVVELYCKDCRL